MTGTTKALAGGGVRGGEGTAFSLCCFCKPKWQGGTYGQIMSSGAIMGWKNDAKGEGSCLSPPHASEGPNQNQTPHCIFKKFPSRNTLLENERASMGLPILPCLTLGQPANLETEFSSPYLPVPGILHHLFIPALLSPMGTKAAYSILIPSSVLSSPPNRWLD